MEPKKKDIALKVSFKRYVLFVTDFSVEIIIFVFYQQIRSIQAFSSGLGSGTNDDVFSSTKSSSLQNKMKIKVKAHQSSLIAKSAFDDELEESKIDKESSEGKENKDKLAGVVRAV